MSLSPLLTRGIRSLLGEHDDQLRALVAEAHLDDTDATEHVRQTVEAVPGLLLSLDGALSATGVEPVTQFLFLLVLRYLLQDDDLVPTRPGEEVRGLLDDVYLVHRAAQELREHLRGVDLRSVDGGARLLTSLLPEDAVARLDTMVIEARRQAERVFQSS